MNAFTSRRLAVLLVVFGLGLGLAARVQAQTVVVCDVPFDFSVGGHLYPSGAYSFTVGNGGGSKMVLLRSREGREGRFVQSGVEDEPRLTQTVLRFHSLEGHYLLTSLSIEGDDISLSFPPTRAERELMFGARQSDVVTVLARR